MTINNLARHNGLTLRVMTFVLAISLSGCGGSDDAPNINMAKAEFASSPKYGNDVRNGVFKVKSFEKTNGQRMEALGFIEYKFMFSAEVEYLKSSRRASPGDVMDGRFSSTELTECAKPQGREGYRCVDRKPGDMVTFDGALEFELSEKGWIGGSGKLYEFGFSNVPVSFSQANSENKSNEVIASSAKSSEKSYADPLIATWQFDKDDKTISFGPNGSVVMAEPGDDTVYGTYERPSKNNIKMTLKDPNSDNTQTIAFNFKVEGANLTLIDRGNPTSLTRIGPPDVARPEVLAQSEKSMSPEDQFMEGYNSITQYKMAVSEYIQSKGRFPATSADVNLENAIPTDNSYVDSINFEPMSAAFTVTFGKEADRILAGKSIQVIAQENGVRWNCYSDPAIAMYASRSCKNKPPTLSPTAAKQRKPRRERGSQ